MSKTKSIIYKKQYSEEKTIPDLDVNQIGEILIEVDMIPHFLDYELVSHDVNFRNIREGTRNDIIYHYVDTLPIFKKSKKGGEYAQINSYKYRDTITKVDIVSFFTNPKEGKFEHCIYQIGARYGSDEYTINDLYGLGELNYDIEDYDKAIKFYNKALEYEPDDAAILTNLGLAHVYKQEYEKAIHLYKKALEIESEDAIIWDNLGLAYEYNGDYKKAEAAYQKAFELDPDDIEIKKHRERIRNI